MSRANIKVPWVCGSFYSPHIFKFNERIKLDGISVGDQAIIESFKIIEAFRHEVSLTYFEFNTCY